MENSRRSAKSADPVDTALRAFAQRLSGAPARARPMLVAYSGGLDSSVLLHAAARVFGADALVAVHVHHGLQPQADAWAQHCADQARALGVECVCRRVRAVHGATDGAAEPASTGDGLEAWARRRRYAALEAVARARAAVAVLTAHHADDQVETVLMRIARGTGADGLTAMRAERPLSRSLPGVVLARPLLSLPRAVVRDYARDHDLRWIEDPSNRDPRLLRNAVRTRVLPALDAVAPAFRTHLLRTVAHVAVAADAARARAQDDLMRAAGGSVHDGEGAADPVVPGAVRRIDRRGLAGLGADRQAAALRAWCAVLGVRPPTQARLDEMHRQLMEGRGPYGRVRHEGMLWTRYRDTIEVRPLSDVIDAAPARDAGTGIDAGTGSGIGAGARAGTAPRLLVLHWNGEPALPLPHTGGTLWVVPAGAHGAGVSAAWLRSAALEIGPGRGAERLRLQPGGSSRSLRHRYQERGIPALLRPHLPVIRVDGRLLYAAGLGPDRSPHWPYASDGVRITWRPDDPSDPRAAVCHDGGA